jgi:hypothetical protein
MKYIIDIQYNESTIVGVIRDSKIPPLVTSDRWNFESRMRNRFCDKLKCDYFETEIGRTCWDEKVPDRIKVDVEGSLYAEALREDLYRHRERIEKKAIDFLKLGACISLEDLRQMMKVVEVNRKIEIRINYGYLMKSRNFRVNSTTGDYNWCAIIMAVRETLQLKKRLESEKDSREKLRVKVLEILKQVDPEDIFFRMDPVSYRIILKKQLPVDAVKLGQLVSLLKTFEGEKS